MKKNLAALALSACLSLGLGVSHAATLTFNAADNGWYTQTGSHSTGNTNTWTGTDGFGTYRNSFYNFNLGSLPSGQTITSASVTFYGGNGQYVSPDPFETVQLWDVTTVPGLGSSASVYNDLMSGVLYGQYNLFGSNFQGMPTFSVSLSSAAFADIMADSFFSIGAHISTLAPNYNQVLWSSSGSLPAAYLTINLAPATAVPEPGSIALFGIALAGLGAVRRRRAVKQK